MTHKELFTCPDNFFSTHGSIFLQQAEEAEKGQPPMVLTCKGIVKAVIELDVDAEDRKRTWKADAEAAASRGSIESARAIYEHALSVFPGKKSIWRAAATLEKARGTRESLDELLQRAVTYCPQVRQNASSGKPKKYDQTLMNGIHVKYRRTCLHEDHLRFEQPLSTVKFSA